MFRRFAISNLTLVVLFAASCTVFIPATGSDSLPVDAPRSGESPESGESAEREDAGQADETHTTDQPAASEPVAEQPPEPGPESTIIAVRTLAGGTQSAIRVPAQSVITSKAVFEDVWAAIHGNQLNPPPPPQIDFRTETAIVLILGERPSAGYSVRVGGVRRRGSSVVVEVEVTIPAPDAMTAQVMTSAFRISAIGVAETQVMFTGDDVGVDYDP